MSVLRTTCTMSQMVYHDYPQYLAGPARCNWCSEPTRVYASQQIAATNTEYSLLACDACRVVYACFRGTDSRLDWAFNLMRWKTGADVHAGFAAREASVHADVVAGLERYCGEQGVALPALRVVACGHSLGGATAILFGIRLRQDGLAHSVSVVTFGSPRVGGVLLRDTAAALPGLSIVNVRMDRDIVPHLPSIGYVDIGTPVDIASPRRWYSVGANHSIDTYVDCIKHRVSKL